MNLNLFNLYEKHKEEFETYLNLLLKWNKKINLTAITNPKEVRELHFLDSLNIIPQIVSRETIQEKLNGISIDLNLQAPLKSAQIQGACKGPMRRTSCTSQEGPVVGNAVDGHFLEVPLKVLDIGSGAGFPGLVIKIVCPEIHIKLVDSVKKKCDFIKIVVKELGLIGVEVLHKTIEKLNLPVTSPPSEDKYDFIVSRAVFSMKKLIELSLPNLKKNGIIIGMKGFDMEKEIKECEKLLSEQNFELKTEDYELPSGKKRKLAIISQADLPALRMSKGYF